MKLSDLPGVNFADYDEENVKNTVIDTYQKIAGRTLADGDPVRLFLLTIASVIIEQRWLIDQAAKMNMLAYAKGDYLDHLGILLDTTRIPAAAAETELQYTLSAVQADAVVIPAGTRVTAPGSSIYFSTETDLVIPAGDTQGSVTAQCTVTGINGNGVAIGSLKEQVDPLPYVDSVRNTNISSGGADQEDDDTYRERIKEAPERFSNAGSKGAYEYWAKSAYADISSVGVFSPEAGTVQIIPLLKNGEIPGDNVRQRVADVCNSETVRPLTDKVIVIAPTQIRYDIQATYQISSENSALADTIKTRVESAVRNYILWQRSALGRDIDPSKLYQFMVDAGATKVQVTKPELTVLKPTELAVVRTNTITLEGVSDD